MSQRVYVDTNILLDYFLERNEKSHTFMAQTLACKYSLIVSQLTLKEAADYCKIPEVFLDLLENLGKLQTVSIVESDEILANTLPTHYADAVHAAVALRLRIPLLTANVRDFTTVPNLRLWTYDDIS